MKTYRKSKMEISGLILAGGRSSRMGVDKGSITIHGKPLVSYVAESLAQVCNRILICASSWNFHRYQELGFEVIQDEFQDLGPIAGLISGMGALESELVAVAPCDTPLISPKLYIALLDSLEDFECIVPRTGSRVHVLHGIYLRQSGLEAFKRVVREGGTKPILGFKYLRVKYLDSDQIPGFDPSWLLNLNTPEDLKLLSRMIQCPQPVEFKS